MEQRTRTDGLTVVSAIAETLRRIDTRLIDHGARVAYAACELAKAGHLSLDPKTLFLLSLFHDVGAYKTDEIDRMLEFETRDVRNHAIYGYLFLKYLTPLRDNAEAILYHHADDGTFTPRNPEIADYAALIFLCDRFDILVAQGVPAPEKSPLFTPKARHFRPAYVTLLQTYAQSLKLAENMKNGGYHAINNRRIDRFQVSDNEAMEYLKMIVYTIDFHSATTVTHSISTVSVSEQLAALLGLPAHEQHSISIGAWLHDLGKIEVPYEILESPGRLSPEQMVIMRRHVEYTADIIGGIVPDDIFRIAVRHHEKLDGSGYPAGLTAKDLSLPERIVAVADVTSALTARRSYKEAFPEERVLGIIREMSKTQLDPHICDCLCENFQSVMARADEVSAPFIEHYHAMFAEYEKLKAGSVISTANNA